MTQSSHRTSDIFFCSPYDLVELTLVSVSEKEERNLKVRLSQGEFGKEYQGKIEQKKFRRYRKDMNGKAIGVYYQKYSHTADGRWFDNGGFPCAKPHHEAKDPNIEEEEY